MNSTVIGSVASEPYTDLKETRKAVVAGMVGHILEWYDFAVYGFVATYLALNFFPASDGSTSLLAALATFGVGFVARPLGGVLFGRFADKRGRRDSLLASYIMMAVTTVAIGLLPTHASLGILAPVLLVFLRLLQGLAAGGEVAGAIVFLVEWGGDKRRGFAGSFHQVGSGCGFLLGSLTVTLLTAVLTTDQMGDWGWRVPFLIGGIVGPVGFFLRRNVEETPLFRASQVRPETKRQEVKQINLVLKAFFFNAFWSIVFYFFLSYLPTFAQRSLHVSSQDAFWVSTISLSIYVFMLPLFGHLSDKFGRKPFYIISCVGYAVLLYPVFSQLASEASITWGTYLLVSLLFVTLLAVFAGPAPATISEIFPTKQRGTLVALGYSMGTVVFGGFTPFLALWLTEKFATPLAPIVCIAIAAAISAVYNWYLEDKSRAKFM